MPKQKPNYGGQALIEGVMFAGKKTTISAIRRKDGTIEYFKIEKKEKPWVQKLKKIPFIRGIAGLFDSLGTGTEHLNHSADLYEEDHETKEKKQKKAQQEKKNNWVMILGVGVLAVISFLFVKLIFTLVPVFIANLFSNSISGHVGQIVLESLIKFLFLLLYLYAISYTPLVNRVFQFFGAEHKVINCYEHNMDLTIENVQKQSRLHYRCGSSFILFTVFVGLFVYLFFPTEPLWLRVLTRILLIPVVLGISYEVLQLTNRLQNIKILNWIALPGLYLQKLTTKEPADEQVEVAIASFQKLLETEATQNSARQSAKL